MEYKFEVGEIVGLFIEKDFVYGTVISEMRTPLNNWLCYAIGVDNLYYPYHRLPSMLYKVELSELEKLIHTTRSVEEWTKKFT